MLDSLPSEIIEYILFYLSVIDLMSVFSAFNIKYNCFSDYFWKTLCLREQYIKSYTSQNWLECFLLGANLRLGNFTEITECPDGTLKHVFLKSLVTSTRSIDNNIETCYIHLLDDVNNNFNIVQTIEGEIFYFEDEFCLVKRGKETYIYNYNRDTNLYIHRRTVPERFYDLFGISSEYCTLYDSKRKCLKCYEINTDGFIEVQLSPDVKFVLSKRYHNNNIAITTVSAGGHYEIKVYDIFVRSWIINLESFGNAGITNDPNIWLSSNFIASCDISYRVRGNYFGPFIVWDKKGNHLFRKDIQPSSKHYLRCFFTEENVILTTSEDIINVFNHLGDCVTTLNIKPSLLDVIIINGRLLLALSEGNNYIAAYDLIPDSVCLYRIQLGNHFSKFFNGHFLFCTSSSESHQFKVIKYF